MATVRTSSRAPGGPRETPRGATRKARGSSSPVRVLTRRYVGKAQCPCVPRRCVRVDRRGVGRRRRLRCRTSAGHGRPSIDHGTASPVAQRRSPDVHRSRCLGRADFVPGHGEGQHPARGEIRHRWLTGGTSVVLERAARVQVSAPCGSRSWQPIRSGTSRTIVANAGFRRPPERLTSGPNCRAFLDALPLRAADSGSLTKEDSDAEVRRSTHRRRPGRRHGRLRRLPARIRSIRVHCRRRARSRPRSPPATFGREGPKLAVTEASSTGVIESFLLLTADFLGLRVVPADNGIHYAICPVRATCPYPGPRCGSAGERLRRLAGRRSSSRCERSSRRRRRSSPSRFPTPRLRLLPRRARRARRGRSTWPRWRRTLSGNPARSPAASAAADRSTRSRARGSFMPLGLEPTPGGRQALGAVPLWRSGAD